MRGVGEMKWLNGEAREWMPCLGIYRARDAGQLCRCILEAWFGRYDAVRQMQHLSCAPKKAADNEVLYNLKAPSL